MIRKILIYTGLSLIVLIGLLMIYLDRRQKANRITRVHHSVTRSRFYQDLYLLLLGNPLARPMLLAIRRRYQLVADLKEFDLRNRVVSVFLSVVSLALTLLVAFVVISKSLLTTAFGAMVIYFLAQGIIEMVVSRLGTKVMKDQIDYHDKFRHHYYRCGEVVGAVFQASEAMTELSPEMAIQAIRIHDILQSRTLQEDMIDYYDTAPNRFLKLLLGLLYTGMEFGDTKDDKGRSQLLNNLSILNQEIRLEVFKQDKINYLLKSLNIIVLMPLVAMGPIKNWASDNFFPLKQFYESSTGIVIEMVMYVIVITAYLTLRKMQAQDRVFHGKRRHLTDIKPIHGLMDRFMPVKYSRRRFQTEKLLKEAGEAMTPREFYARKALLALGTVVVTVTVAVGLHVNRVRQVLYEPDIRAVTENFLGGRPDAGELEKAAEVTAFDRAVLKASHYSVNEARLKKEVAIRLDVSEKETLVISKRILLKATIIRDAYFKWYELIACLFLAGLAYLSPDLLLRYKRQVVAIEMDNEVSIFQSTVLMLSHIDRMDVEEVLEWLAKYAVIFKEPLEVCLTAYDAGAIKALETLKGSVDHKGMKDLVDSLQRAVASLSLADAFDELEADKAYFFRQREETNLRIIEKKKASGNVIGFFPTWALIGLYFAFPLLYSSSKEMLEFYNNIKAF